MNRLEKSEYIGGCILLILSALACGQSPVSQQQPSTVAEARIHLDITVRDQQGKPVPGLALKDFTLFDNSQPLKIASLQAPDPAGKNPPVEVLLLIDALNLSKRQGNQARSAVVSFLEKNGGRLGQPVTVFELSDDGLSSTPESSIDGNALASYIVHRKGLTKLSGPEELLHEPSDAALRNRFSPSSSSLKALGVIALKERAKQARKVLIWIGNGWPANFVGRNIFQEIVELSTRLRESRISVNRVSAWPAADRGFQLEDHLHGVQSPEQADPRNLALDVLASETGGVRLDAVQDESGKDLTGRISDAVASEGVFYAISFDPPPTSVVDEYHDLEVKVSGSGVTTRTYTGYYDQPEFYDRPATATERLDIAQLEQLLTSLPKGGDADLARRLAHMELTERMSTPRLTSWRQRMPGQKSWSALVALADSSVFLPPALADLAPNPKPDIAMQRKTIAEAVDYLEQTIPKLPNFFATRTTTSYTEEKQSKDEAIKGQVRDQSLHLSTVLSGTVFYRNGNEMVDAETATGKKPKRDSASLVTRGTFGSILATIMLDGVNVPGAFAWSHWELGANGPLAIFRYSISRDKSHFEVSHCCKGDGNVDFRLKTAYHGEIAIDPESGAILRLTQEADLPRDAPLTRSATMVEYGAQEIGGKNYICPVRSVSFSRGRRMVIAVEWGVTAELPGSYETVLNDVSFTDYHIFRSQSRVLTDDMPIPEHR